MNLKRSQIVAQAVMCSLDSQVWNTLADKAISKMPKFKLAKQSEVMLNDFAVLNADGFIKSAGVIQEDKQQVETFKENMIVGTSKIMQSSDHNSRNYSETAPYAKDKKRLTSAIQLNSKHEEQKKKNLFRLTMPDFPTQEEQKMYDTMRTAKYDNIRYNQSLEENQKERRAMSEHRSLIEKKRFKEMKTFTYDYQGKLISLGKDKNPNAKINVVNMKPQFGNPVKGMKNPHQKYAKTQNQTMLEILNKRVVGIKTPAMQASKEPQKQKDERGSRHVKLLHQTPNMLECLKDGVKVQMGVTITDINTKSKFSGGNRNRNQIKNARLTEFHGQFRQLEKFREKLMFKKLKFRDQHQPTAVRTQYIQSSNAQRIKTQVTDKQSRVFTTVTGLSKRRGVIDIKNQRLYTQNFIQDIE